jgi:hypothetical protein
MDEVEVLFIGPERWRKVGEMAGQWRRATLTIFNIEAKGWESTGPPIEEGKRRRRVRCTGQRRTGRGGGGAKRPRRKKGPMVGR